MAGNKNSGRKSRFREVEEGKLGNLCVNWIMDNWAKFDDKTKLKVALIITPRTVADKSEQKLEVSEKQQEEIRKQVETYQRDIGLN